MAKALAFVFIVFTICECQMFIKHMTLERIEARRQRRIEKFVSAEIAMENTIDFYLYTRNNTQGERLNINNFNFINSVDFDRNKQTKMIIHGFRHSKNEPWMLLMREALCSTSKWNIIVVDWSSLANTRYPDARRNTRVVGKHIGKFCDMLAQHGIPPSSIHLIGHSLGAHVAGYAGASLSKGVLQRITGLDPARPLFENPMVSVDRRLDEGDAIFVDVVHTNAGGLGCVARLGHVDFYPNGGAKQPGCDTWKCSHMKACEFFTESVKNPDFFQGFHCESYSDFQTGNYNKQECVAMGLYTSSHSRGKYYFNTV